MTPKRLLIFSSILAIVLQAAKMQQTKEQKYREAAEILSDLPIEGKNIKRIFL